MATCDVFRSEPTFNLRISYEEAKAIHENLQQRDNEVTNHVYNELHLVLDCFGDVVTGIHLGLDTEQAAALIEALEDDDSEHTDEPYWSLKIAFEKAWGKY